MILLKYLNTKRKLIMCRNALTSCINIMNPWQAKTVGKDIIDTGVIKKKDKAYLQGLINGNTTIKRRK